MKTSLAKRSRTFASTHSRFKLGPVAAGCAMMLLASTGAYAQEASLGVVTVTGIRAAIESAISAKKGSDNIVEAISAEDLGKLPDASIAESIARLPGVTAQRNRATGKASDVSLRGMSGDFTGAVLNGREVATSGDGRGASFDQFPSELLGGVLVYKTPDAALMGQGLAGTIDLQSAKPLNYKERTIAANYSRSRSGVGTGFGEGSATKKSLSYVDQFADRTVGLALGYVEMKDAGAQSATTNNWGGGTIDREWPAGSGTMVSLPRGMGGDILQTDQQRKGYMGVLQFKPNAKLEQKLDYFYSKGSTLQKVTGMEGNVGLNNVNGELGNFMYDLPSQLTAATIANGLVQAGTIDNWKGNIRNHLYGESDEFKSFGLNTKYKTEQLTTVLDLAQSQSIRHGERYETYAGLPGNYGRTGQPPLGSLSWTGYNTAGTFPKYSSSINYTDASIVKLTDVFGWSGSLNGDNTIKLRAEDTPQAGYYARPTVQDNLNSFRLSTKGSVNYGPVASVEVGINYSNRTKDSQANEGRLVIKGSNDPYAGVAMPGATVVMTPTGIPVLQWNPEGSLNTIYDLVAKFDGGIYAKIWNVNEKVTTTYLKADLDGDLFGVSYVGNIGGQMIGTNQTSSGNGIDNTTCLGNTAATCPATPLGAVLKYNDFNPSLNLAFNVATDQVLRVAAAKVMSRANMGDMRPGISVSFDNNTGTIKGDGGNPFLEPFRAKSFDVSYEKYFGKKGYVSVAGFYKKLDSYIYNIAQTFDFKPYIGSASNIPGSTTVGLLTIPRNGTGGRIQGIEVAASLPLSMLWKPLDGFGAQLNYSNTDSAINIPTPAGKTSDGGGNLATIPMPGLSKAVMNRSFYYEANGFQFRLSNRKRSDFLGNVVDVTNDQRTYTYVRGESVSDVQIGYEFQTGYLKGLSVLMQGNNITNTKFEQYDPKTGETVKSFDYGKSYAVTANYKF